MKSITLFVLLIFQMGFAQQRSCGTAQKMKQIFADSIFKKQYLTQQAKFQKITIESKNSVNKTTQEKIIIPVAVHFPTGNIADRICLIKLAESQINVLNSDLRGTNQDISTWTTDQKFYPGINTGSVDVEFVIATKNHPQRTDPNLVNDEPAVTVGYDFGNGSDSDPLWKGYFNIVVKELDNSTLGYSPVGAIITNGDAFFINNNTFGTITSCNGFIPKAPYNLGRTVTHELGHFLNLLHTFGDESGCIPSNTDNIDDTPKIGKPTSECPDSGSVDSCETLPALTMNYMDYTYDKCMYMFTEDQSKVIINYVNTIKNDLKTDVFSDSPVRINLVKDFAVYKNPNKGEFTIQFEKFSPEQEINIFDITGRNVYSKTFVTQNKKDVYFDISIPNVKKGIYYILIKNNNNPKSTFKVFVD